MLKHLDFKSKRYFSKTQVIPALQDAGLFNKARKLTNCGDFIYLAVCQDCYTPHFNGSNSCKDKFCPVCTKKRSLLWLSKMIPICQDLLARGYHLNLLTYTVRLNKEHTLKQGLDLLYNGFRYMTAKNKQSSKLFSKYILGGVRSLEVKIGEDPKTKKSTGIWHPHFHMVVCTRNELPYTQLHKILYDTWNASLNTVNHTKELALGTVNLRSFKGKNMKELIKSLCEVFKYMTKFDWQGDKVYELVTTLDGMRMQSTFGNFRRLLHEQQIERDMDKTITEIEHSFCAVCGGDKFADVLMPEHNHLQIYDLKHKYSDIDDTDEILNEYKEIIDNEL